MSDSEAVPPSERTTVKRGANRAVYGQDEIRSILAAGTIAHVGVQTPDGPIVLPMAYGVRGEEILVHGGVANAMLRAGRSVDVCITVTILDGLVIARSPLHNSMNYRSVVIRGEGTPIGDQDDKTAALKVINDHLVPSWDTARPPSDVDLRQTMVLAVPLAEASAKVRSGDPIDEVRDLTGPHWSGVLPLVTTWGSPRPAADLLPGIDVPAPIAAIADLDAHRVIRRTASPPR